MHSFSEPRSIFTTAVAEPAAPRSSSSAASSASATSSMQERRLPIKRYATLAAAEIISRLDLLSNEEMRLVQSYEIQHRNRRAVLEEISWRLGAA